jgi:hypothetical protein
VPLVHLETLWFNTGTLCNIACHNCYIESSPRNDRLVYLSRAEVRGFLGEAAELRPPPAEIGFTGGEPFMNPDILGMIEEAVRAGFRVLVLTNAMKPMQRWKAPLLELGRRYGARLTLRVSLDHDVPEGHETLRGKGTWQPGLAGRMLWDESERALRAGAAAHLDLYEKGGRQALIGSHADRARRQVTATFGWRALWAAIKAMRRVQRIFPSRRSILDDALIGNHARESAVLRPIRRLLRALGRRQGRT